MYCVVGRCVRTGGGYLLVHVCVCPTRPVCVCEGRAGRVGGGGSRYSWSVVPVRAVSELYSFAVWRCVLCNTVIHSLGGGG